MTRAQGNRQQRHSCRRRFPPEQKAELHVEIYMVPGEGGLVVVGGTGTLLLLLPPHPTLWSGATSYSGPWEPQQPTDGAKIAGQEAKLIVNLQLDSFPFVWLCRVAELCLCSCEILTWGGGEGG